MKKRAWIAPLTVLLDQLVKGYTLACLRPGRVQMLIPGVVQMRYAENTGMAFSWFSGNGWLLGLVSAVLILLGWLALRRYRLGAWSCVAAMLMLGGAVGNMLDRFVRGFVVDMFEALFVRFAIFNVADVALTVGVVLMAISLLCRPEEWRKKDGVT